MTRLEDERVDIGTEWSLGPRDAAARSAECRRPSWMARADARFEIRGFDRAAPFASFLPGVAGANGAPLWCMYVNRGQAVCSFGYEDKDHAIAEFFSANWAYQMAGLQGFRTFLVEDGRLHEPFATHTAYGQNADRAMSIQPHALEIVEEDPASGWRLEVSYCAVVGSIVPALARRVRLSNIGVRRRRARVADGLPVIVPAGVSDIALKKFRNITETFVRVSPHSSGAALFALPMSTKDEARVESVSEAVFYGAWLHSAGSARPLPLAVDPDAFFGPGAGLVRPEPFVRGDFDAGRQTWSSRLPCAMAVLDVDLAPGASVEWNAYAGFSPTAGLVDGFANQFASASFPGAVEAPARRIVAVVARPAFARTASRELDGYLRQNYLDNVLRGGVPVLLPSRQGPRPIHLYARRHGDLERDYNDFKVPAHPLSEGAGNFRDILQNRRNDVWAHPESAQAAIASFAGLLQPDGYNPLVVEGFRWRFADADSALVHCPFPEGPARDGFVELATKPFAPGRMLAFVATHGKPADPDGAWLRDLLADADCELSAKPNDEGYWIDHWTYLVDMLEAHEAVLPDRHAEVLQSPVGWFEPTHRILPRAERYQRHDGKARQYGALGPRKPDGRVEPWPECTIASKLVHLAALKAMTLDPEGRGIEMEAGRPGWNDALNGLPGLFGSSTVETMSLIRLCGCLRARRDALGAIRLPGPAARLVREAKAIASKREYDWKAAADLRERFREAAYAEAPAALEAVDSETVDALLQGIEDLCRRGIESSLVPDSPLVHTYFLRDGEAPAGDAIDPCAIAPSPLPLFLEGQVLRMRTASSRQEARAIHAALRDSALRDHALANYLLNEDLSASPLGIGRARAFDRGVYENESIWLHMAYKLLVELLRHGLHDEFMQEARTMLVPFMPPERYGRSIFENSSFIASSSSPDPARRGRGFVARLSGSTAEFIHIWLMMAVGPKPFSMEEGDLSFRFQPALPGEWFAPEAGEVEWEGHHEVLPPRSLACAPFGKTLIVYHNDRLANTWGADGVRVLRCLVDGAGVEGAVLRGDQARRLRSGTIRRVDVVLG